MATDINLRVWLETDATRHPPIVTPYVQSAESQRIHYKLEAVGKGHGGTFQFGQNGSIVTQAGQPTALSQFSITVGHDAKCQIEIILINARAVSSHYHFDCPR